MLLLKHLSNDLAESLGEHRLSTLSAFLYVERFVVNTLRMNIVIMGLLIPNNIQRTVRVSNTQYQGYFSFDQSRTYNDYNSYSVLS